MIEDVGRVRKITITFEHKHTTKLIYMERSRKKDQGIMKKRKKISLCQRESKRERIDTNLEKESIIKKFSNYQKLEKLATSI